MNTVRSKPIEGKETLRTEFPECFGVVGEFEDIYRITLDPKVPSGIHPQRRVALKLLDDIKTELEDMEKNEIIKKVEVPTEWVNSLVYRRKPDGRIRICLDPKDLNKAIKREHHVTPTLEEILPKLVGAKVFTIIDTKQGYWNIKLDEQSSYYTTFNSPFGRYRFLRCPFGLKMSQDIFQRKMDQVYEGLPGVIGIADDILVYGPDEETHDENLRWAMQRTSKAGNKLNLDKCQVKMNRVKFFGLICEEGGVRPDPEKVEAFQKLDHPTNEEQLHRFQGLATYLGPFIPILSQKTDDLRKLIKKNAIFEWLPAHQKAFEAIKDTITGETKLAYFDTTKDVTLQVDASQKGLGAVLLQEGKPIAFASKALTGAESRYANIERELLAVVYGCEKFHTYLYGRKFVVESDHKPLEMIQKKNIASSPPRLQRMLLRLQMYDFEITWRPGSEIILADALSRTESFQDDFAIPDMDVEIHEVQQVSINKLEKIRNATMRDDRLQVLKEVIMNGWPHRKSDVPEEVTDFWNFREELSIDNGVVLKADRIVIPKELQKEVLNQIHTGHLGIQKSKLKARSGVYWPGMNNDIEEMVSSCAACQAYQPSSQKRATAAPRDSATCLAYAWKWSIPLGWKRVLSSNRLLHQIPNCAENWNASH